MRIYISLIFINIIDEYNNLHMALFRTIKRTTILYIEVTNTMSYSILQNLQLTNDDVLISDIEKTSSIRHGL